MIYQVLRPMARLACLLYFRKIFLLNVEGVPKQGPLLLVCNHPSAFFEPCLLAVLLPRPLYFLTRGDFFKKRFFSWFLRQTHQVPIFRVQDGFDKLRNNPDTFAFCYQALSENKAILIFPESWTVLEKRLRPLQKGAARLALGALEHIPTLNILPVGITFSDPTKFRSLVTIKCGNLIPVIPPKEPGDERTAIAKITEQIRTALRALMVHIEQPEREPVFDTLQQLLFNSERMATFPVISSSDEFPAEEIRLEECINALSDEEEGMLSQKITTYETTLRQHRLTDRYFMYSNTLSLAGRALLLPGALFLILGKCIFALPAWLVHRFLNARIHNLSFYGPVKWAMGCYLFGVWFTLCLILGYVFGGLPGLLILLTWLMLGSVTLRHFHDIDVRGFLTPWSMSRQSRSSLQELRKAIIEYL